MLHNRLWVSAFAVGALACALTGCTPGDGPEPSPTSTNSTASPTTSGADKTGESSSAETTNASDASDKTSASKTPSTRGKHDDTVAKAYERFGSLAPKSLFDQLETCMPGGVDKSLQCSGPEVGQFQFFESENKALTTTQLLTGLDSSRIVERDGNRLVGWSSLGSTAVITVVDTDKGLVMQQMMSSEKEEPKDRIIKLGLVSDPDKDSESTTDQEQVSTSAPSE